MPRYVRPSLTAHEDAAIEVFGNRLRMEILRLLREHGPLTRGELTSLIDGTHYNTVQTHLRTLERHGVITSDPPPDQRVSGERPRYSVNLDRVEDLYHTLGQLIGIERS